MATDRLRDYLRGETYTHICKLCGERFVTEQKNRVYCSHDCRTIARDIKIKEYNNNRYKTVNERKLKKESEAKKNKENQELQEFAKKEFDKLNQLGRLLVKPRMQS